MVGLHAQQVEGGEHPTAERPDERHADAVGGIVVHHRVDEEVQEAASQRARAHSQAMGAVACHHDQGDAGYEEDVVGAHAMDGVEKGEKEKEKIDVGREAAHKATHDAESWIRPVNEIRNGRVTGWGHSSIRADPFPAMALSSRDFTCFMVSVSSGGVEFKVNTSDENIRKSIYEIVDIITHAPVDLQGFFLRLCVAGEGGRIFEVLMDHRGISWKHRAMFVGVIANGDDVVEGDVQ